MRKFTLLLVAALVSVASFGQKLDRSVLKAQFSAQRAAQLKMLKNLKPQLNSAFKAPVAPSNVNALRSAKKAASTTVFADKTLVTAFSSSYEYINGFGGMEIPMDTTMIYTNTAKDSMYVDLLSKGWGFIAAKIYPSQYEGVDSLVFAPGQVVGQLKNGKKLAIYNTTLKTTSSSISFTRNNNPIRAYYVPQDGLIMTINDKADDGYYGIFAGDSIAPVDGCYRFSLQTLGTTDSFDPYIYNASRTLTYTIPAKYSSTGKAQTVTDTKTLPLIPMTSKDENGKTITRYYIQGFSDAAHTLGDWQVLDNDTINGADDTPVLAFTGSALPNSMLGTFFSSPIKATGNLADSLRFVGDIDASAKTITFEPMDDDVLVGDLDLDYSENALYILQYLETVTSFKFDLSTTDIKGITNNAAAGKAREEYFDLLGRRVSKDAKGVLIKRSVAADGTVSAQKIVK